MEFVIRRCRPEDADAICRLSREELGYDDPLERRGTSAEGC